MSSHRIVTKYAKMWPREVFDIKEGNKLPTSVRDLLREPGVYLLYRDDHPYYVGKTSGHLFSRIWAHPDVPKDRYYNFWDFFSAFVVPERDHIDEVEGILIASMPTANSAIPKISRIRLPAKVVRLIREQRIIRID